MNKVDKKFVISNKLPIVRCCFLNTLLLRKEAGILMKNGSYARAHFLIITALEEVAKATMIMGKKIETKSFQDLIDHKFKTIEIVKIIAKYFKYKLTEDEKRKMSSRIIRMREDALYTRLKPTPKDQFMPDDRYWRKRAIIFCNYLDKHTTEILKLIKNKPKQKSNPPSLKLRMARELIEK